MNRTDYPHLAGITYDHGARHWHRPGHHELVRGHCRRRRTAGAPRSERPARLSCGLRHRRARPASPRQIARRQAVLHAEHTATALKRLLGMRFGHPQVRQLSEMVAYRIVPGPSDELRVVLRNEPYSVVELVAAMLLDLKRAAEAYLGQPVSRAVMSAPLSYTDAQRIALRDAARLAGLEVLRIIADPIAAALAHGIGTSEKRAQRVAVYDLGGGTFDFALLDEQRHSRDGASMATLFWGARLRPTPACSTSWCSASPRITRSTCAKTGRRCSGCETRWRRPSAICPSMNK